jgi:hypothetical protein
MTPKWRRYLRFWRPDVRADVDDELAFHMQERVDDLVATGMDVNTARQEAVRLFGDWNGVKQECIEEALKLETEMRRLEMLDVLKQDAIYALRLMRAHRPLPARSCSRSRSESAQRLLSSASSMRCCFNRCLSGFGSNRSAGRNISRR